MQVLGPSQARWLRGIAPTHPVKVEAGSGVCDRCCVRAAAERPRAPRIDQFSLGRTEDAENAYRAALRIGRKLLGSEHDEVTAMINDLALLLDGKGEHEEAERLYREALAVDRRKLGEDHPFGAIDLYNMSRLLCRKGRAQEGMRMAEQATKILAPISRREVGKGKLDKAAEIRAHALGH